MEVRGTRRSGWSLLLGASLAAVAIVSLLTFATLARRTSLGDAPGPRVVAIDPRPAPGQVLLPSPTPSGESPTPPDETTGALAVAPPPVGAPDVDPTEAPTATLAGASGDGRARTATKDQSAKGDRTKSGPFRANRADGGGRTFASGDDANDKHGKGPKDKPADHPSNKASKSKASKSKPSKPAKSSPRANGHGDSHGKGHVRGRGKGHDKHGD